MEAWNSGHRVFDEWNRVSQPLRNDRCQNILYKAVFEHFKELAKIAAFLLTSKSFQNSSFGANFIINFAVDENSIALLDSVLSPSSCFSLQFVPSLRIKNCRDPTHEVNCHISTFVAELVQAKYLPLQLQSLWFERARNDQLASMFAPCIPRPRLQSLNLDGSGSLDDATVTLICKSAVHLTNLSLAECVIITDSSLQQIATLTGLTSLCLYRCSAITDAGLAHVSRIGGITNLNLAFCPLVTDVGVQHISKLSRITKLDLSSSAITDQGLAHVSKLSKITNLNLSGFKNITDSGFQHLSELKEVEVLDVCWSPITDVGLDHISLLDSLTSLYVNDCDAITDQGLDHLWKLSGLTYLNISWAFGITAAAKAIFMDALPHCLYVDYG